MKFPEYCENLPMTAVTAFCTPTAEPAIGKTALIGLEMLAPPPEKNEGLVIALSYELANETRLLEMARMFVPKVMLWFSLTHDTSSVKLCTGVMRVRVRVKPNGENTNRKLIELAAESPCWLNASRV